jgi:HAD superfamily hydrolase (TIGR01549 family)
MKIKCVFFDAGETLIYRNPSLVSIAHRYLRAAGLRVGREKLAEIINAAALDMRPIVERGKMTDSAKWVVYIREVFKNLGIKNNSLAAALRLRLKKGTSFRAHRDAVRVVEFLNRKGFKTGIISNAPAELEGILLRTGLLHRFKYIIISEKAGAEKPHRKIFLKALKMSGTKPSETLYVGDNFIADVRGAANAGIVPVWIKRNTKNAEFSFSGDGGGPVRKISSLKGLIKLMKKEGWI